MDFSSFSLKLLLYFGYHWLPIQTKFVVEPQHTIFSITYILYRVIPYHTFCDNQYEFRQYITVFCSYFVLLLKTFQLTVCAYI